MTEFKLVELPDESVVYCPQCAVVHSRGKVFVEVFHNGDTFVYAELLKCCSHIVPALTLYDSQEDAQPVADRIAFALRDSTAFFQMPLVSKKLLFGT